MKGIINKSSQNGFLSTVDGKNKLFSEMIIPISSVKCSFVNGDGRAGTLENKAGGGQKREETERDQTVVRGQKAKK